ncbi:endonuclease/exonuclease/phosphatase family protein [Jidongwangia harbinensis]|uniref:endonuclease/exonuclease/phosphatase family protein n=1 Tax=Jidongwangia harbinensis TaxID=2878561 RepID=UPI001CDA3029|nr:endonuclease/exonuclease/phosphatase family protein [Jidongwangia harbinensis]MCA2218780.1 endonuclease/exonuclease/phosphatase family protein [Jidongwangia harbinensis]
MTTTDRERTVRAIRWILILLSVVSGTLVAGPAQAAPAAVRVMTFNLCGNVCRHGEVAGTAAHAAYQIRSRRVDVAFLQEVCYSQFLGVRSRLRKHGYTATFARTTGGGRCDDDDRRHGRGFGLAIVAKGKLTGRVARFLPSPASAGPEPRALLGATVTVHRRRVFVATTHTAPGGPNLDAQLAAVHRYLAPIAAGRRVLFGGDLNMLPHRPGLDVYFSAASPGGRGVFRDADGGRFTPACRCGRPTFRTVPRKIDYLFGNERFFRPRSAAIAGTGFSDHRVYVGDFVMLGG